MKTTVSTIKHEQATNGSNIIYYSLPDYIRYDELNPICWILDYYVSGQDQMNLVDNFNSSQEAALLKSFMFAQIDKQAFEAPVYDEYQLIRLLKTLGICLSGAFHIFEEPEDFETLPNYVQTFFDEKADYWMAWACYGEEAQLSNQTGNFEYTFVYNGKVFTTQYIKPYDMTIIFFNPMLDYDDPELAHDWPAPHIPVGHLMGEPGIYNFDEVDMRMALDQTFFNLLSY